MARYIEEEKSEFCELAQEIGIAAAMRELSYPKSYNTARYWLDQRGIEITVDSLKSKAAELKHFYGYKEQMLTLQTELDRIQEMLESGDLDADGLNKLSNALSKTINAMELISGRVTERRENHEFAVDSKDLELMELINEAKAKNHQIEQEVNNAASTED